MIDWFPVMLSIKIAAVSTVFAVATGIFFAYLTTKYDFWGKTALEAVITLPLVMPPIVTGFLLLLCIGRKGIIGDFLFRFLDVQLIFTPYAAVVAGTIVAFPLMYQSTKAAFLGVDHKLEDAARTLGASELRVFMTISLPLSVHGIVSGTVLSFSRALGEFGATIMVAGNIVGKTQTIPLAIYFASESNELELAGMYVFILSMVIFSLIFLLNQWKKSADREITNA